MAKNRKNRTSQRPPDPPPRSLAVASEGIQTGLHFARFMSALMTDLIEGRVSPGIGNAACNAGGKLLKVVELQHKYGTPGPGRSPKVLDLTMNDAPAVIGADRREK
jgi:hypothetical protein